MNQRDENKELSFKKILNAAAIQFRRHGFSGVGIAAIMKDAGLTNGAFYSHFKNKDDLIEKSFEHALTQNRPRWIKPGQQEPWAQRLKLLSKRYLTKTHRDDLSSSCALAALVSDSARTSGSFNKTYEKELYKSLESICDIPTNTVPKHRREESLMFMALCVGGLSLSRAVNDPKLSEKILTVCQKASERITFRSNPSISNDNLHKKSNTKDQVNSLDQYPFKTFEKLRYADTDRQGHVNNAVFATILETGRVEILYNPSKPITSPDSSFVIAHQSLDFHSELVWPGRVDIGSRIISIGKSSILFEHGLFQESNCAATAKVVIVQINEIKKKSEPLSKEAIEYLSEFLI